VSLEGDIATYEFLAVLHLDRLALASEILKTRKDAMVKAFQDSPAWALAIRKILPTIDNFLELGRDVWDGFANRAHIDFKQNLVRAHVANALGVPQDSYVRLTPHVAEFIK